MQMPPCGQWLLDQVYVCLLAAKASTGYEGGARTVYTTPEFDKQWYAGQLHVSTASSLALVHCSSTCMVYYPSCWH